MRGRALAAVALASLLASVAGAEDAPADDHESGVELLPPDELFDALHADPRDPHFSVIYQRYIGHRILGNVGSANLGESFALLGGELSDDGRTRWEFGIFGDVFSIFDMDARSFDLVNSDFWVGGTFALRRGGLSGQMRLYHRSSHLGDEFIDNGRGRRVDFGNEGIDVIASAEVHPALRIYGGGGVIVNSEPQLDPLSVQAGVELRSPWTLFDGRMRPVAAFDFQAREELRWQEELSVTWGIELANPEARRLRVAILGSYFTGNSPHGQFFGRRTEYLGAGLHLYF